MNSRNIYRKMRFLLALVIVFGFFQWGKDVKLSIPNPGGIYLDINEEPKEFLNRDPINKDIFS